MAGLTGLKPSDSYPSLLRVNDVSGIDSSLEVIEDGSGNDSPIKVSTTNVTVLDHQVNTQYAYFGVGHGDSLNFSANTHISLPFMGFPQSSSYADDPEFGSDPAPALVMTTADGANTDAALFVPCMWYIPDDITIDAVYSIEGADESNGDTTRMHLMSYTFTSDSTSCLTAGAILATNSDVTNAGSEQAYLSTWTVSSPNVSSAKVILAMFRCDSANSDYSLNVTVKYHLR